MEALICNICGGELTMVEGGEFAVCDSCGMKHDKRRVQQKAQEISGSVEVSNTACIESLMKRGHLHLEDMRWEQAIGCFEKALDIDPEYASAYWGLLMARHNCQNEDQLSNCLIEYDGNYKKALRFANAEQKIIYQSISDGFRKSVSQILDNTSSKTGIVAIEGGFVIWDFIKPINPAEYYKCVGGDNPTVEWLTNIIPADMNPIVKCNNAKVVIVNAGLLKTMDIISVLEEIVKDKSTGIIIVSEPCELELLQVLLMNSNRGTLKTLVILLNGDEENRNKSIRNISNVTGAKVFNAPEDVRNITDEDFGVVRELYICGDKMMLVASRERIELLEAQERSIENQSAQGERHKREQDAMSLKELEQHRLDEQSNKWATQGLCRYCGGQVGGVFGKKCKSCGKPN